MKKQAKAMDTKTSKTALMNCITRAASYYEKRKQYRSEDHIAPLFLPFFLRLMLKMKMVRNILYGLLPKGILEYAIARTKYVDSIFMDATHDGFRQVVILGSGFDSRGLRFCSQDTEVKIFELDAPATQDDKLKRLKRSKIALHENMNLIPIDLEKESAATAIVRRGFEKGKKTLFLMEGLLPLLSDAAVNTIFEFLNSSSGHGSEVVFDFVHKSVLQKENKYYGEKEIYDYVQKAGEPIASGMDGRQLESFLSRHGFSVYELMNSDRLNESYFSEESGKNGGVVNEALCIVRARKKT